MKEYLKYKDYLASVEFSIEDMTLYGVVIGLSDSLTFEIDDPNKAQQIFEQTIDEYLDLCKQINKVPDKTYSGTFNIRISPSLHRQAAMKAEYLGISLNKYVEASIEKNISNDLDSLSQKIEMISNSISDVTKHANSEMWERENQEYRIGGYNPLKKVRGFAWKN